MLWSLFYWILLTAFHDVICFSSNTSILPIRIKVTTETTRKACTTLYGPEDNPSGETSEADDQCIYCSGSDCPLMQEPSQDSMIQHVCHVTVTRQELHFNSDDSLLPCSKHNNGIVSGTIKSLLSELQSMISYIQTSFQSLNQTDSKSTEIKYDTNLLKHFKTSLRGLNVADPSNHLPLLDLIGGTPLKTLKNNEADCDINWITNNVLLTLQHLNQVILGLTTSQNLNDTNPPDASENEWDVDSTTNEVSQDREPENETNAPENEWDVDSETNEVSQETEMENEPSPDTNITSTSNIMSVLQHLNQIIHHLTDLQNLNGLNVPVNKVDVDTIINDLLQHLKHRNETSLNEHEIADAALLFFLPKLAALNGSESPALTDINPIINSIQPILLKLGDIKNDLSILLALNLTGAIIPPHLHFPSILKSIQLALQHLNGIVLRLEKTKESIHKGNAEHQSIDFAPLTSSIQAALKLLKQILIPSQGSGTAVIKQIDYDLISDMVKSSMEHFNRIMVELSLLQILNSTGFHNPQVKGVINLIIQDMIPILNLTGPAENIHIDDLIKKAQSFLKKMIIIIDDMQILNEAIKKGVDPSTLIGEMTQLTIQLGVPMYKKPQKFSISLLLPALHNTGSILIGIVEKYIQLKSRFIKIADDFLSTVLKMSWNIGSSLSSFLDETAPLSPLPPLTDQLQGLIEKKKDIFQILIG